jgi:hypothetical protein
MSKVTNRAKRSAYDKAYYAAHREKRIAQVTLNHFLNRDRELSRMADRRARKFVERWQAEHPDSKPIIPNFTPFE